LSAHTAIRGTSDGRKASAGLARDEDETRKANELRFKLGQQILGVNSASTGVLIGPVWHPARQAEIMN